MADSWLENELDKIDNDGSKDQIEDIQLQEIIEKTREEIAEGVQNSVSRG